MNLSQMCWVDMVMSAPPLDIHAIDHHIVRSAIEALNGRNKKQWYELFSDNPAFTEMEILSIYQMMRKRDFWSFTGLFGLNRQSRGWG